MRAVLKRLECRFHNFYPMKPPPGKNDVTSRQAATSLQASESTQRHIHEIIFDAVATVKMSGEIVEFNSAFRQMLGYSENELLGLTYEDLTPKQWHAMEADIIRCRYKRFPAIFRKIAPECIDELDSDRKVPQ